MAVDRTKIIETFKVKFPKVPLSNARLDKIADKLAPKIEENEIESELDEMDGIYSFAEMAKDDDRRRTEANKKPKPDAKPKPAESDNTQDDQQQEQKPADDSTTTLLKQLLSKVEKLETEKNTATIQSTMKTKLTEVPEVFYKGRIPQKVEDIDAYVEEIQKDWTEYRQTENNEGFKQSHKPAGGGGSGASGGNTKAVDPEFVNFGKQQAAKVSNTKI